MLFLIENFDIVLLLKTFKLKYIQNDSNHFNSQRQIVKYIYRIQLIQAWDIISLKNGSHDLYYNKIYVLLFKLEGSTLYQITPLFQNTSCRYIQG